ncbi:MAG: DUF4232 domain-containing protein [Acidobacteriaceae bacterium]
MLLRSAALASAVLLLMLGAGCADGPPAEAVLPQAIAPTQSTHPDPNAPYVIPGPPRKVVAQPTPAAAAEALPCTPDALKVEEIAGNMHGAWHSIKVGFRNQASVACRLSGYPLVALFNGEGQSLGSIAVQRTTADEVRAELAEPSPPKPAQPAPAQDGTISAAQHVILVPRAVAAFQVVWSAGESCSKVARLLVTAPGTTRTFSVAQPMSVCKGRIQVTPLGLDQTDD